jgi:hypothetical protein
MAQSETSISIPVIDAQIMLSALHTALYEMGQAACDTIKCHGDDSDHFRNLTEAGTGLQEVIKSLRSAIRAAGTASAI